MLLLTLVLCGSLVFSYGAHWTYHGSEHGVDKWSEVAATCGGSKQSPVDIKTDQVISDSQLGAFTFTNFNTISDVTMTLTNNGHAAQVTYTSGDLRVSGGGLGSEYRVTQFHFHWGSDKSVGSEHTVDGKHYPIEMHVVTYNLKYDNMSYAVQFPDGLAVLGVFFEMENFVKMRELDDCDDDDDDDLDDLDGWVEIEDRSVQAGFEDLVHALASVQSPGSSHVLPSMELATLLPQDTGRYYRYQGSLTTPPCSEVVTWTLFKQPLPILQQQLDAFRDLLSAEKNAAGNAKKLVNNYRPVQPLNGRQIKYSA